MSRIAVRFRYVSVALTMVIASGGPASAQVTFDWATIGNLCNPPDPQNEDAFPDIGTVCYEYRIAKHEVTNAQYAAFLNAVADDDPNNLYNPLMDTPLGSVIRSGSPGSYTYAVGPGMGDKPVTVVSAADALRFVNWIHNGQPSGPQGGNTTESGAYVIDSGQNQTGQYAGIGEPRSAHARFLLPSLNELYKAMFYQPAELGGDADGYWLYATQSNVELPADPPIPSYYGVYTRIFFQWTDSSVCCRTESGCWLLTSSCEDLIVCEDFIASSCVDSRLTLRLGTLNGVRRQRHILEGSGGFRVAYRTVSADLDLDLDVDLRDFQEFQNRLGGPK